MGVVIVIDVNHQTAQQFTNLAGHLKLELSHLARLDVFGDVVVSNKGDKTVVVQVERRLMHPVYKKFITTSKKYAAHDEENRLQEGDSVKIRECQPVSKRKFFEVIYDEAAKG